MVILDKQHRRLILNSGLLNINLKILPEFPDRIVPCARGGHNGHPQHMRAQLQTRFSSNSASPGEQNAPLRVGQGFIQPGEQIQDLVEQMQLHLFVLPFVGDQRLGYHVGKVLPFQPVQGFGLVGRDKVNIGRDLNFEVRFEQSGEKRVESGLGVDIH